MTFSLVSGWILHTFLIAFGVMLLDFLISFLRPLFKGSLNLTLVLSYLKDMIHYFVPLLLLIVLMPFDPLGWIVTIFYVIACIGVVVHYLKSILSNFK